MRSICAGLSVGKSSSRRSAVSVAHCLHRAISLLPYQGLLWCYMHSSVEMIILLTTSLMVTSWHDCWFQVARSVKSGDHFLEADLVIYRISVSALAIMHSPRSADFRGPRS